MRLIKIFGLAAVAALAAMAFVTAGTASADTACTEELEDTALCPEGKRYTGLIVGLGKATLTAGVFSVTCDSTILGHWVENEGAHTGVLYLLLNPTFTNCSGSCKEVKEGKASALLLALVKALDLLVHVTEHEGNGPAKGLLIGCKFIITVNCEYKAPASFLLTTEKDFINANITLTRSGDSILCPAEGAWTAKYLIEEDQSPFNPLYITALP